MDRREGRLTRMLAAIALAALGPAHAQDRSYVQVIPDLIASAPGADWRTIPGEDLIFFEMASGTCVMQLAPFAAPEHAAQLRALVRSGYFNDSAVLRVQENYLVRWGDPTGVRSLG